MSPVSQERKLRQTKRDVQKREGERGKEGKERERRKKKVSLGELEQGRHWGKQGLH